MRTTYAPSRGAAEQIEGGQTVRHGLASALTSSANTQIEELLTEGRLRDEFLAILGHEMRSPLVAVQNAVRILNREAGQDLILQRRMHSLIERQVRQMLLLTAGLRDVSRMSRGQLHLQRERVDLRVVLADAIETMEPEIEQRGHQLTTRGPDKPVWLQADADRLGQVFQNLLGNACKFTPPGGDLALFLQVRDQDAVVRVRDSGMGIAADALPHIFDLFMQADQTVQRSRSGLGVGLALVQTLVELHGGRVSVRSAGLGQGSEFTVRLPVDD